MAPQKQPSDMTDEEVRQAIVFSQGIRYRGGFGIQADGSICAVPDMKPDGRMFFIWEAARAWEDRRAREKAKVAAAERLAKAQEELADTQRKITRKRQDVLDSLTDSDVFFAGLYLFTDGEYSGYCVEGLVEVLADFPIRILATAGLYDNADIRRPKTEYDLRCHPDQFLSVLSEAGVPCRKVVYEEIHT